MIYIYFLNHKTSPITITPIMNDIQIGENTHHQLHAITLVNFKTRKTRNKRVGKPILPEFVEFAIYLLFIFFQNFLPIPDVLVPDSIFQKCFHLCIL